MEDVKFGNRSLTFLQLFFWLVNTFASKRSLLLNSLRIVHINIHNFIYDIIVTKKQLNIFILGIVVFGKRYYYKCVIKMFSFIH